jgi:hypothetical protein
MKLLSGRLRYPRQPLYPVSARSGRKEFGRSNSIGLQRSGGRSPSRGHGGFLKRQGHLIMRELVWRLPRSDERTAEGCSTDERGRVKAIYSGARKQAVTSPFLPSHRKVILTNNDGLAPWLIPILYEHSMSLRRQFPTRLFESVSIKLEPSLAQKTSPGLESLPKHSYAVL